VRVDGRHHRVRGAHPGPAPAHDVGIWLGAYKPRMLALTGRRRRLASQQRTPGPTAGAMNAAIDAAATDAGREPAAIRRLSTSPARSPRATAASDRSAGGVGQRLIELTLRGESAAISGDRPHRRFWPVAPPRWELVAGADGHGDPRRRWRAAGRPATIVVTGGWRLSVTPLGRRSRRSASVWDGRPVPPDGPDPGAATPRWP
jgi:hypothetical protein